MSHTGMFFFVMIWFSRNVCMQSLSWSLCFKCVCRNFTWNVPVETVLKCVETLEMCVCVCVSVSVCQSLYNHIKKQGILLQQSTSVHNQPPAYYILSFFKLMVSEASRQDASRNRPEVCVCVSKLSLKLYLECVCWNFTWSFVTQSQIKNQFQIQW